jgi:hypothetical protein
MVDLCQILTEICITQFDIVVDLRPPRQRWRNTFWSHGQIGGQQICVVSFRSQVRELFLLVDT